MHGAKQGDDGPYKKPTVAPLVDIEEALKAGHAVEPRSDIQFEAMTEGASTGEPRRRFGIRSGIKRTLLH